MSGFGSRLHIERAIRESVHEGVNWRPIPLSLFGNGKTSGGLTLTAGTTPKIAAVSSYNVIQWDAGVTNSLLLDIEVPGDYNETKDALKVFLLMDKTTTDDTADTIDATILRARGGTASPMASVASVAAQTMPLIAASGTPSLVTIDFSARNYATPPTALRFKGLDQIQVAITPAGNTSAVYRCWGASIYYGGDFGIFDATQRAGAGLSV